MLETLDAIILAVFCVEIVVKVIGKFDRPWYYFHVPRRGIDRWNTFDFVVVAGSFLPGSGSLLTILRLLRLLRVLKLLKASALQVIVVALISGLGSIAYIGVILIMVFYIFGILAMILYKANDPWHLAPCISPWYLFSVQRHWKIGLTSCIRTSTGVLIMGLLDHVEMQL